MSLLIFQGILKIKDSMTALSTPSLTRRHLKNPDYVWYGLDMKVQLFVDNPPGEHTIQHQYIYLTSNHLKTQTESKIYYFFLFRTKNKRPIAVFHMTTSNEVTWNSPVKAPFGGIQSMEKSRCDEIIFLLKCVEKILLMKGGKRIIIKTNPENYDADGYKKLDTCYKRLGYESKEIFKNHLITVTNLPFDTIIRSAENRRLKKCRKALFTFCRIENSSPSVLYNFIKTIRDRLGYSLSLTLPEFKTLVETFPNEVKLFGAYDGDKLIAISVTVLVNQRILYNFLAADAPEYRQFSPMVFVIEGIYQYCQQRKISILDLGISLDHFGNEKPSLVRFKENLAGKECRKITWQKDLDTQTIIHPIKDGGTGFMANNG